jgi:hypothetical protein
MAVQRVLWAYQWNDWEVLSEYPTLFGMGCRPLSTTHLGGYACIAPAMLDWYVGGYTIQDRNPCVRFPLQHIPHGLEWLDGSDVKLLRPRHQQIRELPRPGCELYNLSPAFPGDAQGAKQASDRL